MSAAVGERILGVDPGSRATGVAVLDWRGGRGALVQAETFRVDGSMEERLVKLFDRLTSFIERWQPMEAAFEKVFTARNPQSALKLGQARGVLLLAVARKGIPVAEYSATRVKMATLGYGRASKEEMQRMIALEFGVRLAADAADAVAVALTHGAARRLPATAWGKG